MSYFQYAEEDDLRLLYLRDEKNLAFPVIAKELGWSFSTTYNRYRTLKAVETSGVKLKYPVVPLR